MKGQLPVAPPHASVSIVFAIARAVVFKNSYITLILLRVNKGLEGKAQFHWLTQKVTHEPRVNARVDDKYSLSGELYLHQSTLRSGLMPGLTVNTV